MNVVPVRHPKYGIVAVNEDDIPKFAVPLERVPLVPAVLGGESVQLWPETRYQSVLIRGGYVVMDTKRLTFPKT